MARGTSKAKNHKAKGEKKRKEDKLLPTVLDILVNLPTGEEVILKGISTDRILDVRKLLAANVETCHLTRYSLSHQVRGEHLSDAQEVVHLKPCVLTLVEEPYTEAQAIDHVRRLLDLVACTTFFGPSEKMTVESSHEDAPPQQKDSRDSADKNLKEFADITRLCPPSKLVKFYEFFSFGQLKSPVQTIRKVNRQGCGEKDFFSLEVKVANGKLFTVVACSEGFYHAGKQHVKIHSLVDLLRHLSKAFDDAYEELLKGFNERNKFANIPYNLRANTWVVPPVAAESPAVFPPLPAEDETWGGNGGGQGRNPESLNKPWARQFAFVAKMPCGTPEEREVRDHKAFVLHNYFVDVATTHAVALIKELDASRRLSQGEHVETCGTLKFTISRDSTNPCTKVVWKIDSSSSSSQKDTQEAITERNLLKGITADESTVVHDTNTLSVVLVRHQGYKAVVEAIHSEAAAEDFDPVDPPEGGANALNANSLRTLLHKKTGKLEVADEENHAKELVCKLLEDGIADMTMQQQTAAGNRFIRWELGACWIQHLGEAKKDGTDKNEKQDKTKAPQTSREHAGDEESPLKDVLSKPSLERLKGTGTELHRKSVPELVREAEEYYKNVALPKLVSDFAALELSPVEGRTLTDFMHIRGLRISSLGHLAELCAKLPHIRSLCIHEMIIRAFKHLIRGVISLVKDTFELASAIATTLNTIFGQLPTDKTDSMCIELPIWKWLELFVRSRYGWKLTYDPLLNLRKYAILRGLCYKVGIEMVPRDYDFTSTSPFTKADVISLVPVYKHAICSSADGRTLLESSKAALDKGKLEDAVSFGSKALAKLIAVCGPYHRMTAGAYSLLAVVLYHTGDFIQAMIYQQKALDINERELGLDHPDTMKSYGDLAVFYYRLQHTELALRYVNRALYLLHLICGPSHPNTAATYINVAMMEEALGNAHVALRYLHEALKCNERLLGKDHIQTAASYHAIAIALSLMEAYTLSVHHEQTTFQILQAKLGPDDIRTQDAAAWLEYFDSKAVEQQEAARTGAPKPDPTVASKGHLSVSDLLDFINAEVAASGDKENKRKRLKLLLSKHGNKNMVEEATSTVDGSVKAPDVSEVQAEKETVGKEPIIKAEQEIPAEEQKPKQEQEHTLQDTPSNERTTESHGSQADEEGWLEATSRGKHHKRLAVRPQVYSYQRGGSMSRSSWKPSTVPASEVDESSTKVEHAKVELKKLETDVTVQEVSSTGGAVTHDQVRSYRDVAAQARRPVETVSKVAETPALVSDEGKLDTEAQKVENEDATSQAASTTPSVTSKSQSESPKAGRTTVHQRSKPASPPALSQTKTTTTVAVTPIRKQVQLPSHSSNGTQACLTRGSAAAEITQASPSPPIAAAEASTTPGSKKPMNPFAVEFVPGRKWHPLVTSKANVTSESGTQDEAQHEMTAKAMKEPVEPMTGVKLSNHALSSSDNEENRSASQEEEALTDNSAKIEKKSQQRLPNSAKIDKQSQQRLPVAKDTSGYYSSDSNCTEERSSTEDSTTSEGRFKAVMKKQRNNTRSRGQGRWQRRSDGAITRVYRLQGDKSSANPQLRTTSTFTDVPEPHTLQPVSIMRRSVSVS